MATKVSSKHPSSTVFNDNPPPTKGCWRWHSAYHEAAHAVIAYHFGWWVNHEDVEIDDRQYCGLRRRVLDDTEQAAVCVSLAGWGAEMRLAPDLATSKSDDDLIFWLRDVRRGNPDESDDADVFQRLMQTRPNASNEDLLAVYRSYEAETATLLSRADVWESIERVAHALLESGKLSGEQVEVLLVAGVKDGAKVAVW